MQDDKRREQILQMLREDPTQAIMITLGVHPRLNGPFISGYIAALQLATLTPEYAKLFLEVYYRSTAMRRFMEDKGNQQAYIDFVLTISEQIPMSMLQEVLPFDTPIPDWLLNADIEWEKPEDDNDELEDWVQGFLD